MLPPSLVPRVTKIGSSNPTEDEVISEGERTDVDINRLLVYFKVNMQDPVGSTAANDVTNPANYLLLVPGPNRSFETTECSAVQGDDLSISIDGVSYDAAQYQARVFINHDVNLSEDHYRFLVCDRIQDLGNTALDGDGG
jgi:hypothetical protein